MTVTQCSAGEPIDRLETSILVDNSTDILSSPGPTGLQILSTRCLCCAVHGFACIVKAQRGTETRSVLFDTGPDPLVLMGNAARLGIDWGEVDAIVLSHGHFDHTGASLAALNAIRNRRGGARVPVYLHPLMFRRRGQSVPGGTTVILDDVPSPELLREAGGELIVTTDRAPLFAGLIQVSGEIARVTTFETGLPGHLRRCEGDRAWEPDPLIIDERFLVADLAGKGLVVMSACSHAGIVNVLHQAQADFPSRPLYAVIGGLHLSGANEAIIPQTVEALRLFAPSVIAAGHCTGWRAQAALMTTFGERFLAPTAVGKSYIF
jgi:7,8-dihydropterin-6-yl-methyl-4-(beta-D-ribofuranosyl)aminobenzene 5'-phosphate synthase